MTPPIGAAFQQTGTEVVDALAAGVDVDRMRELATTEGFPYQHHTPDRLYWNDREPGVDYPLFDVHRVRLLTGGELEATASDLVTELQTLARGRAVLELMRRVLRLPGPESVELSDVQVIRLGPGQRIDLHRHTGFAAAAALCLCTDRQAGHVFHVGPAATATRHRVVLETGSMIVHRGYRLHAVEPAERERISMTWLVNPEPRRIAAAGAQSMYWFPTLPTRDDPC